MNNKTVFSLVNSAVNVTLPAFADERRAAAPLLLGAGARRCPAHTALSSKPTASRSGCRTMGQTDGRPTVIQTLLHICTVCGQCCQ